MTAFDRRRLAQVGVAALLVAPTVLLVTTFVQTLVVSRS